MPTGPTTTTVRSTDRSSSDPDPLYDAPMLAFVYAAWAAATMWVGELAGLWVLVGATTLLCVGASVRHHPVTPRSFVVEFATILLFCSAAIAGGVLIIGALPG